MDPTQSERLVAVSGPLKKDSLLFHHMTAKEELGRLFRFDLELLSDEWIKFEDVVGQSLTVEMTLPSDQTRYFNGYVTEFADAGTAGRFVRYKARLRPWLWFLTRTADCRIFPDKNKKSALTTPEIIMEVFREHGFTDFDDHLEETYKKREHCVQYRETDFDFVSRLMEEEGIYYYFKHEDGKHTLVLCDAYSSHETVSGYDEIPYFPPGNTAARDRDHIFDWNTSKCVQPGMYALRDFDFELPKKSLEFKASVSRDHAQSKFEMFDYPGRYVEPADGDKDSKKSDSDLKGSYEKFAKNRIEGHQAQYERCNGQGNARGVSVGALFTLTQYPRDDLNREYLIVSATHTVQGDSYGSEGGGGAPYASQFAVVDAKQPFRLETLTPKPYVRGPQTAIVVGKDGEEIWTDQYGRVMVQFHWDRYGESNEKSSCWVRVAQAWAGKTWGGIFIPRIGQEVIVEFLEGDPDRPIITGSVYNGDNMPPYALPANQTQSGVKSRSTKGGSEENFNEIRFEDKKDDELIYIQAEKDYEKLVKHDRRRTIGNDETLEVGNNQTEKIGANKSLSIGEDHTETIGGNATIDVSKNETVSVGEKMNVSVGKDRSLDVGENHSETVAKNKSVEVGKNMTRDVGESYTVTVSKDHKETVAKGYSLEAKAIFTEAKDSIEIKVGKASIIMKKNGDIQLKGGKISIKGSGDVVIKGSKIGEN